MLVAPIYLAISRFMLATRPSLNLYVGYRIVTTLVMMPFSNALMCMNGDLLGRGSALSILANRRIQIIATFVRMVLGQMIRKVKSPRTNFLMAACSNFLAWLFLLLSVKETLPDSQRKSVNNAGEGQQQTNLLTDFDFFCKAANPLSFIHFFNQSPSLRVLAVVMMCNQIPAYNTGPMLLRRFKHGWTQDDQSTQLLISQVCGVSAQFLQGHLIRGSGLKATAIWGQRLGALMNVNTYISPTKRTFAMNPILQTFRNGQASVDRVVEAECVRLGLGQGQLQAARSSLGFPVRFLAPLLFGRLYSSSLAKDGINSPGANFLVAAVMQMLNAEVVMPWAWKRLNREALSKVSLA